MRISLQSFLVTTNDGHSCRAFRQEHKSPLVPLMGAGSRSWPNSITSPAGILRVQWLRNSGFLPETSLQWPSYPLRACRSPLLLWWLKIYSCLSRKRAFCCCGGVSIVSDMLPQCVTTWATSQCGGRCSRFSSLKTPDCERKGGSPS